MTAAHYASTIATGDTSSDGLVLKESHVPYEPSSGILWRAECERPLTILLGADEALAEPAVVHDAVLVVVAVDMWLRRLRHILHQPPSRTRFTDATLELGNQVAELRLVSVMPHHDRESCERLAGRPADDAIEDASGRMKAANVAAPEHVGPAEDRESLLFESHVEQADSGKQTQHQHALGPILCVASLIELTTIISTKSLADSLAEQEHDDEAH